MQANRKAELEQPLRLTNKALDLKLPEIGMLLPHFKVDQGTIWRVRVVGVHL